MWRFKIAGGSQYNDPTYYIIVDKDGNEIASVYSLEQVQNIIVAHNIEYVSWLEKFASR
jgi:hypothetical protein